MATLDFKKVLQKPLVAVSNVHSQRRKIISIDWYYNTLQHYVLIQESVNFLYDSVLFYSQKI